MNKNKLALSTKFLVFALSAVILLMAVIGVSNIFADPTIFDLVEEQDIGTFKPSRLYDAETDDPQFYDWLTVNQIAIEYDMWKDTDGDGDVDVEDVYSVEGFETEMYMTSQKYSMLLLDEKDNFLVVPLYDYKDYNGVLIEFDVAPNADLGEIFDHSRFFYDAETKVLYLDRELVRENVEEYSEFASIRAEGILVVEEIDEFTREITVATVFDADIENTHGLLKNTPNGRYSFSVKKWSTGGLVYQLVDSERLAYASKDNMTVFVNHVETENWAYDETTGKICIDCVPYNTEIVVVKFNDVVDANSLSQTLQASMETGTTAQAASFSDIKWRGSNPFLHKLYFEQEAPQLGATTAMEFLYFTWYEDNRWKSMAQSGACDLPLVNAVTQDFMGAYGKAGGYYITSTLSAYQTTTGSITRNYGKLVYNTWLFSATGDKDALNEANNWAVNSILNGVDTDTWSNAFTDTWRVHLWRNGSQTNFAGRYVAGMNIADSKHPFLGGILKDDSGYAFFDVSCAKINAPESLSYQALWEYRYANGYGEINEATGAKVNAWDSKATIVEIDEANGFLYICAWARGMCDSYNTSHVQRVLAYSRVPYEFNGKGTFTLVKKDAETGEVVPGAEFKLYTNADCTGDPVAIIETGADPIQSGEIKSGKYYLKETAAPKGYVPDTTVKEIEIQGGKNTAVEMTNRKQRVTVEMNVYDRTTIGSKLVGVEGIRFELQSPNTTVFSNKICVTNSAGKLTFEDGSEIVIPAIGTYKFHQLDTVKYYAYDDVNNSNPEFYCKEIIVDAKPHGKGDANYEKDYKISLKHYEQRQTVSIRSHVQDVNLGEGTGTFLGGLAFQDYIDGRLRDTNGSIVTLLGAKYQLYAPRISAEDPLFLGYNNGTKVVITDPNTPLQFKARAANGTVVNDRITYSNAIIAGVDKAYIEVTHIIYNGVPYPAPNAVYEWRLFEPSSGYYLDDDTSSEANQHAITTISAEWKLKDDAGAYLVNYERNDVPVKMVRQSVDLKVWSKTFSEALEANYMRVYGIATYARGNAIHKGHGTKWTSEENGVPELEGNGTIGTVKPDGKPPLRHPDPEINQDGVVTEKVDVNVERDLYSDSSIITQDSIDSIVITSTTKTGDRSEAGTQLEVESDGLSIKTIYAVQTAVEVVDIKTGERIREGMVVGYYLARYNENGKLVEGYFIADDWGTTKFDNPNTNGTPSYFPAHDGITESNQTAGGGLPNGKYNIVPVYVEDSCVDIPYVSQDVSFGLGWSELTSNVAKKHYETVVMVYHDPNIEFTPTLPIAPDPDPEDINPNDPDLPEDYPDYPYSPDKPYDPTDPYDPEFPDDPSDPDDSEDIPLVPYNWVLDNTHRLTYRVVDPDNITITDGVSTNDFSDKTTTNFAFFVYPNDLPVDKSKYTYEYNTWFYYEIPKSEYDIHDAICSQCSASDERKDCGQYATKSGLYYRRFNVVGEYQGGDELSEVIVLNEKSFGYQNLTSVLTEYATVSGSIYNYNWLNEKLSKEADGTYTIMLRLRTTESWVGVGNMICSRVREDYEWGVLVIKNRQLFPLD